MAASVGVRAVLASSYERIHRWNLIGMGVLPLRLPPGVKPADLALSAGDTIMVRADPKTIAPRCDVAVEIRKADGSSVRFDAVAAIETSAEVGILRAGGVLPLILERLLGKPARVANRRDA